MQSEWLSIREVSFGYDNAAVIKHVSMTATTVHPVLAIVGKSGAGKSTLLKLIGGQLLPQAGEIRVFDRNPSTLAGALPMVFQDHNLFPWKTAKQNVMFALKCRGVPRQERSKMAVSYLNDVGLAEAAERMPSQLSGGMKQRVGLARALAAEPKCLLMDEPLSSLDEETRARLRDDIISIIEERRISGVLVTHQLQEALLFANRTCILTNGTHKIFDLSDPWPRRPDFPLAEHAQELRDMMAVRG